MRAYLPILILLTISCDDGAPGDSPSTPDGPRAPDAYIYDAPPTGDGTLADACVDCGAPEAGSDGGLNDASSAPLPPMPMDELTRVGVSRFEITPEGWEAWSDRAGPSCPKNRAARYDGPLTQREPSEPCADAFEDADGDGVFDALYLGGRGPDRPAQGVDQDNPPEGRVLLFQRREVIWLLITLDVHALNAPRVEALTASLSATLGLTPSQIAVHATGVANGPDAVGLAGPSLRLVAPDIYNLFGGELGLLEGLATRSGVSEAWWGKISARAAHAARRAAARLRPFSIRVAEVTLPITAAALPIDLDGDGAAQDPEDMALYAARRPLLARAQRLPDAPDNTLKLLRLEGLDDDAPIAFLISWGVRAQLEARLQLSGDVPGAVRRLIEALYPESIALWITGAGAGIADARVFIPEVNEQGRFVDTSGAPVDQAGEADAQAEALAEATTPVHALARYLVSAGLSALSTAPREAASLELEHRLVWLPLTNPRYGLAAGLGALPKLSAWISGRTITDAWASPLTTPACGGLGCLRHRLDAVHLGAVTLLTTPGAVESALIHGRDARCLRFDHQRAFTDLDGDGIPDEEDPAIERDVLTGGIQRLSRHPAPVNPQCFDAVEGLTDKRRWILGGVGGGVGFMGSWTSHVNVFEGQLAPALALSALEPDLSLCAAPDCLTLSGLLEGVLTYHAACVADLTGGHALTLGEIVSEGEARHGPWWVEDPEGGRRAEGDLLYLGPGAQAFAPDVDLLRAGVKGGDTLWLDDERGVEILNAPRLELRDHPNSGDVWSSSAPMGGDLIYNGLCDLIHDCDPRPWLSDDPNEALPRAR